MKHFALPFRRHVQTASYVALYVSVVFFVYVLAQITVTSLLKAGGVQNADELSSRPGLLALAYIVGEVVSLALMYAVIRYQKVTRRELLVSKPRLKDIGYGVLGFGAYFLVVRLVVAVISMIFPSFDVGQSQNIGFRDIDPSLLPIVFVGLAILPPLSEELMFRGYLRAKLAGLKLPLYLNALLVSALFGALHGQWNVAVDTFVLSLVMYYVLSVRPSLWATITMHAIKNTLAFLALFIFKIV